jgi:hypothetical protein
LKSTIIGLRIRLSRFHWEERTGFLLEIKKGADAAALFYSLIQTCILNEIEHRKYYNYLLKHVKEMRIGTIRGQDFLPQNCDIK